MPTPTPPIPTAAGNASPNQGSATARSPAETRGLVGAQGTMQPRRYAALKRRLVLCFEDRAVVLDDVAGGVDTPKADVGCLIDQLGGHRQRQRTDEWVGKVGAFSL